MVRAPQKCLLCVFLDTRSGVAYCPLASCWKDERKKEIEKKKDGGQKDAQADQMGRGG